ncbi:hypothetical protein BDN72DRAFT_904604 [Pluteus cervinus]|uniref:Uncharacterized protein n=1 Tax=Pluteus cervinus TaxID=181527 RepID=A0ACD3A5B7_9AGAR|nr:hypothetical protein BDN72DRAFT_904604 [Pluteus cervinus]
MSLLAQVYSYLPSLSTDGITTEEVRNKVDQEISQLQDRVILFKTFRNSLAPVSRLPTEILSKVFTCVQDGLDPSDQDDYHDALFFITWVCREWRYTALATPQIWTIIADTISESPLDIQQIEAFIQRSKKYPLSVTLSDPSDDGLITCLTQMPRIWKLELLDAGNLLHRRENRKQIQAALSRTAPQLSFLALEVISFPKFRLFSGNHPKLESIRLESCTLAFPTATSRSLLCGTTITCLHFINHRPLIGAPSFSKVLISLPNLEELLLDYSLSDHKIARVYPTVTLPNLQTIRVTDDYARAIGFLGVLNIPCASVSVFLDRRTDWQAFSFDFLDYLDSRARTFAVHTLDIRPELSTTFIVNFAGNESRHRHTLRLETTHVVVSKILNMMDVSQVTNVSLAGLSVERLDWFLDALKVVEVLSVTGNADDLDSIVGRLPLGEDEQTDIGAFPKLKQLDLSELDDGLYGTLIKTLTSRRDKGFGLVKLSVAGREHRS